MRALLQPVNSLILLLGLLLVTSTTVLADIHIYLRRDDGGPPVKVGSERTDGGDVALMCEEGFDCFGITCGYCHSQAPSYAKYTRREHDAHLTRHFPRIELRLGEGQETTFARQKLVREGGRLVFIDPKGGKRPLPVGALLLKNNSGQPVVIVSSNPPY